MLDDNHPDDDDLTSPSLDYGVSIAFIFRPPLPISHLSYPNIGYTTFWVHFRLEFLSQIFRSLVSGVS